MPQSVLALLSWIKTASDFQPRPSGQGLVEYALILVLVAVVVIVILSILGDGIANSMYGNIVAVL